MNKLGIMNKAVIIFILSISFFTAYAQNYDGHVLASDCNHWTVTVTYDVSIPGKWKLANNSFKIFKPGGGISVGASYGDIASYLYISCNQLQWF